MRRLVIAATSISFVACSALVSLDGLTGSTEDAGALSDANEVDAISNNTIDGSQVITTDAANANDTGNVSDAGTDVDTRFCITHSGHSFCEDFDTAPLTTNWSPAPSNGSITLDPSTFISPPHSVFASSPNAGPEGGPAGENDLSRVFNASAPTMAVGGAIKLEGTTSSCDFISLEFDLSAGGFAHCYFDLSYFSGAINLEGQCYGGAMPEYYQTTVVAVYAAGYHEYKLSFDLSHSRLSGSFENGAPVSLTLPSGMVGKNYQLGLGVIYNGETGNCLVHADNMLVDTP